MKPRAKLVCLRVSYVTDKHDVVCHTETIPVETLQQVFPLCQLNAKGKFQSSSLSSTPGRVSSLHITPT